MASCVLQDSRYLIKESLRVQKWTSILINSLNEMKTENNSGQEPPQFFHELVILIEKVDACTREKTNYINRETQSKDLKQLYSLANKFEKGIVSLRKSLFEEKATSELIDCNPDKTKAMGGSNDPSGSHIKPSNRKRSNSEYTSVTSSKRRPPHDLTMADSRAEHPDWFGGGEVKEDSKRKYLISLAKGRAKGWVTRFDKDIFFSRNQIDEFGKEVLQRLVKELKKGINANKDIANYFDRETDEGSFCNKDGLFKCAGKDGKGCEKAHEINPYTSIDYRKDFKGWEIDHKVPLKNIRDDAVEHARKNKTKDKKLNKVVFAKYFFSIEYLQLVHRSCHVKKAREENMKFDNENPPKTDASPYNYVHTPRETGQKAPRSGPLTRAALKELEQCVQSTVSSETGDILAKLDVIDSKIEELLSRN